MIEESAKKLMLQKCMGCFRPLLEYGQCYNPRCSLSVKKYERTPGVQ